MSILMGFTSAMETLAGQAFGARNYRLVGVVWQRALLLTAILTAAVGLLWTQAEALLLLLRQARARQSGLLWTSPIALARALPPSCCLQARAAAEPVGCPIHPAGHPCALLLRHV